jgi:hypothetical protein
MPQQPKKVNKRLPYGWKPKVQQILSGKGTELKLHQINDILQGKNSDPVLTKKVATALKKVKADDAKKKARIRKAIKSV